VREPWNLRINEIAWLTDEQFTEVYFHPRKEDGSLLRSGTDEEADGEEEGADSLDAAKLEAEASGLPAGPGPAFRKMYFAVWRARGWREEDVARRWLWYVGKYTKGDTEPFSPWPDYVPRPVNKVVAPQPSRAQS